MAHPLPQPNLAKQVFGLGAQSSDMADGDEWEQDVPYRGQVMNQVELLEMKPSFWRRTPSCGNSFIAVKFSPPMSIVPEVGLSSAPSRYKSVLFPEPDGPTMNVKDPWGTSNETPRESVDLLVTALVRLPQFGHSNHGISYRICSAPARASFSGNRQLTNHEASLRIASIGVMREARHAG